MEFLKRRDIWISHYRLKSKGFLNAISSRREFEGVLIRAGNGYGCIHPWPELGDPSLEKCIEDLSGSHFYPIVRRAMRCAEYDDAARSAEVSLYEDMVVPPSHATLVRADLNELAVAVEAGFETVKLKVGRDLVAEMNFLMAAVEDHPSLKWRLDFNEFLDPETADAFLTDLPEDVKKALDFIEDICPFSENAWEGLWKKHNVSLAVDRESAPHQKGAQILVIKPAVDEPFLLGEAAAMNRQSVVITSYMDHPVGQAFSAWEAARTELLFPGLVKTCGLQTHHIFEKDPFVEVLGDWKPDFKVPEGIGLGFDKLLAGLEWKKL